ncbi:PASTA domain-containing protein [Arthrobacter sp.]|uniref:Stk1 family PASTA domain-containing Ser/Thr kinase n=1 Tax=Arthrobacter sp. TaxID=1667 RepID=UPI00366D4044
MVTEHGSDPLIGTTIDGRYRVGSLLARGGMSTVYLATDLRLHRDVAVKVLYPHLAEDPKFVSRFEAEAITAAKLSHPHVVSVLDQGVDGHLAYLVLEYVKGRTLRHLLRERGRLAPRQALALLDAIVDGLASAHDAGLVHRDMKPENVLLADDGRVKVADFGLARATSNHTATGTLVGTVAYISPELVTGAPSDARSDIYAIGIMLYELLTGEQPFSADLPINVAFRHVNDTVPPPSEILPGLAEDLDELVEWCTAKDPEDRPHDAAALLGELRHIRTSLTDGQLDFGAAGPADADLDRYRSAAGAGGADGAAGERDTEAISGTDGAYRATAAGGPADEATSAIPAFDGATSVIAAEGATSVIPAAPQATRAIPRADDARADAARRGATAVPAALPEPALPEPAPVPTTARQAKRQAKAVRREWDREAQRPLERLDTPRSRRTGWVLAAVLVVLAALVGTAAWFFGAGPGAAVDVPQLSGQPAQRAVQELAGLGVDARQRQVFDERLDDGLVVSTDPAAGTRIRRYQDVQLLVSKGPELFAVPNIVGRTEDDAKAVLGEARLTAGTATREFNESVAAGRIVSQSPAPDSEARRGAAVAYVVSRGRAPVAVPSVVGEPADEARAILESAGLQGRESGKEFSRDVAEGAVISQDPAKGEVKRGSTVTYVVSRGPRMVEVPNVVGDDIEAGQRELEELGFAVELKEVGFGIVLGKIVAQDPASGAVPEGSTVILRVV